jgi:hypothetical protein
VIDWWDVLTNATWIAGAATVLAAFSYMNWQVSACGDGLRDTIKRMLQSPVFGTGMLLSCLGAGLGASRWGERVLWFLLVASFAAEAGWVWSSRHSERRR